MFVGSCLLYVGFTGAVWDVASFVWAVSPCMHSAQALCGMWCPLCRTMKPLYGISMVKTENKDRERRDFVLWWLLPFVNVPRACPSLTTRAHVGVRFDLRWIRPEIIAGKKDRERKQGTKTRLNNNLIHVKIHAIFHDFYQNKRVLISEHGCQHEL